MWCSHYLGESNSWMGWWPCTCNNNKETNICMWDIHLLLRGGQSLKVNRMNYSKLFDLKIRWKISSFLFFHWSIVNLQCKYHNAFIRILTRMPCHLLTWLLPLLCDWDNISRLNCFLVYPFYLLCWNPAYWS
jgi:hypothetical protein